MARLKFHARTTLQDIQLAFDGPAKFTLRASQDGELRAYGKYSWSRDDMLARFGDVEAQERLEESSERAIGLIRRAIDNEFGQGVGPRAFARAREKKAGQSVSLGDLRRAAAEVAPELAQPLMGTSCVKLLTEAFEDCGIDRARLREASSFAQAMSKAVLDLQAAPLRDLGRVDFRRAAQGALLALLFRRMAEEAWGAARADRERLAAVEARVVSFFQPGAGDAEVALGEVYRSLARDLG